MLYKIVKVWINISLPFFCRKITVHHPQAMQHKGPLILASNHPNSFADAILLGALMKQPVHFITRGDVFAKPLINKFLRTLKMIPIFRMRDGKEMLGMNQQTFDEVQKILKKNETVLIFVEGFCAYQTELQLPLKKGAPRIALEAWAKNMDVKILPVWLRYDSFFSFGKIIDIRFGEIFGKEKIDFLQNEAQLMVQINKETENQLLALSAMPPAYISSLKKGWKNMLYPFAILALLVNGFLFFPIKKYVLKKLKGNEHYDSIMLVALTVLYPIYLLLLSIIAFYFTHSYWAFVGFLAMPIINRLFLVWKK